MREKIEQLFKRQLEKIKNPNLRSKVVDVWVNTAKKGGWKADDLEKIPFTLLTDTKGINLIEHTITVTEGAIGLANAMIENYPQMPFEINFDWLIAGGLLHDVGKLLETERATCHCEREQSNLNYKKSYSGKCLRHPISGAIMSAKEGLPDELVNIVACHAKEGEGAPQRVETVLIHQADFATFNPMVMLEKGLLIT